MMPDLKLLKRRLERIQNDFLKQYNIQMKAIIDIKSNESIDDLREDYRIIKEGLDFIKMEVDWLNMAHAALQIAKTDPAQQWSANDIEKDVNDMMKEVVETYDLLKRVSKQLDKRIYF